MSRTALIAIGGNALVLDGGGRRAVITSLSRLRDALAGRAGTSITTPDQAGLVPSPRASSAGSR